MRICKYCVLFTDVFIFFLKTTMLTDVPALSVTDEGGDLQSEPLGAAENYHALIHAVCQIIDECDLDILKATKECPTATKDAVARTTRSLSVLSGVLRTSLATLVQTANEEDVCGTFPHTLSTLKKDSTAMSMPLPHMLHSQLLAYEQLKGSFKVSSPQDVSVTSEMPQWQIPTSHEEGKSQFLSAAAGMKGGSGVFASVSSVRSRPREAVLSEGSIHEETDETVALWLNENFSQMTEKTRKVKKNEAPQAGTAELSEAATSWNAKRAEQACLESHSECSTSSDTIENGSVAPPSLLPPVELCVDVGDAPSENSKSGEGKSLYSRKGLPTREGIVGEARLRQLLQDMRVPYLNVDSPDFDIFKEIEILSTRSQKKKHRGAKIGRTTSTNEPLTPRGALGVLPEHMSSKVEWAPHNVFVFVCVNVLYRYTFPQAFEISTRKLIKFLLTIQSLYRDNNPYHNSIHAADVLQTTHIYLTTNNVHSNFNDLEIFALLFSALVHDVGHVGVNNQFLSKIEHPLATLYNHKSPLENLHTTLALYVLHLPECNFLDKSTTWGADQMEDFRNLTTDIISGTDMKFHRAIIHSVHDILEDGVIEDEEIGMLMKAIVHAADLSNPMKPLHLYLNWMRRINEEFWLQGDEEKKRGLPVSVMCDRDTTKLPESQAGFISFIVKPFVSAFSILLPEVWMERLDENLAYMNELSRKNAMKLPNHVAENIQSEGDGSDSDAGVIRPSLARKASVRWQSPDGTSVEVDVRTGRLVDDDYSPIVDRRASAKKASDMPQQPKISLLEDVVDALFENTEMGGGPMNREGFMQALHLSYPIEPWVDTFTTVVAQVTSGDFTPSESISSPIGSSLLAPTNHYGRPQRTLGQFSYHRGVGVLQTALASMLSFKLEGQRAHDGAIDGVSHVVSVRERVLQPIASPVERNNDIKFNYLRELVSCISLRTPIVMEEAFAKRALSTWIPGMTPQALETLLAAVGDASLHAHIEAFAESQGLPIHSSGQEALSTLKSLRYSHDEGIPVALRALALERKLLESVSHTPLLQPPSPAARARMPASISSPFREPYTLSRKTRSSSTVEGPNIEPLLSQARGKLLRPLRYERALMEADSKPSDM
jgi:hypothetical protein